MAHAPALPAETPVEPGPYAEQGHVQPAPASPGKVAMWLFLATEVMFFTGLIGTYVVLRAGSPASSFSNLYPPATDLSILGESKGIIIEKTGPDPEAVMEVLRAKLDPKALNRLVPAVQESGQLAIPGIEPVRSPHGLEHGAHLVVTMPNEAKAKELADALTAAKASIRIEPLRTENWPKPYDDETNPLSIDLTAANTFILICSSVTMVLALAAIQRGDRGKGNLWLLATVIFGSIFLGVQVYEYRSLMFEHHYPIGVSRSGHFTPDVSIFASCFFTMTGFHGAHVAGGVVMLICILINSSVFKAYGPTHYSPVELVGLYWHFVDLVWILLFTVVYLI